MSQKKPSSPAALPRSVVRVSSAFSIHRIASPADLASCYLCALLPIKGIHESGRGYPLEVFMKTLMEYS